MKKLLFTTLVCLFMVSATYSQMDENIHCRYRDHSSKVLSGFRANPLPPAIHNYDVKFYFLDIELSNTSTYVSGNVQIDAVVTSAVLDTFMFELIPSLTIDSITLNGVPVTFSRNGDEVYVSGIPILNGVLFTAKIWYHGLPNTGGGFFSGISTGTSSSWGAQITWTLSEPFNAKQWWPVKQVLADKADSAWIFITTQNTNKAGSNGLLTAVTNMGNNKLRYEWKTRYPINYYLISAAVSTYQEYATYAHPQGYNDSILILNYVYSNPNTLTYFKPVIDQTAGMIELFSEKFGLYPFAGEKYGHAMAPLGGGMEHQTMTSLGSFIFNLVAHELGHQWFGDYVTCATWQDIWINEGFASYTEYVANEFLVGYQDAQSLMAGKHSNIMSQPGGSVYVPLAQATDINRIFSGRLSYDKGAALVHMIRYELGDDQLFFNVLQTFLSTFANGVATGDDFRFVAESLSGRSFQDFFDQWYYGEGYPIFSVRWAQMDPNTVRIITQQTTSSPVTPLFRMPVDFRFLSPLGGDTTVRLDIRHQTDTFFISLNRTVTGLQVDPAKWNLMQVSSIKNTTGIEEGVRIPMALFPNPAKDYLIIRMDDQAGAGEYDFVLNDMSGKNVMKHRLSGSTSTVQLGRLPAGVYHWQVITEKGFNNGKLMIR
ncbi:MAG: M1 family aminopeptidase [Bacteroidales bacterium]